MTILEQVYASGGDVIIPTLELTCDAWAEPVLICAGFEDQTCVTEDARTLTFIAAGIDVALPKRSNSGGQTLTFAIDNITAAASTNMAVGATAEIGNRIEFEAISATLWVVTPLSGTWTFS